MDPVLAQEPQDLIDQVPPEVLDRLPDEIVDQLRDGSIEEIPDAVIEQLPPGVADAIPDGLLESASANPALAAILVGVGILAIIVFVWGVVKSAFKAAALAALIGGAAWLWFFYLN